MLSQKSIFVNGLIVLAVLLVALRLWLVNSGPDAEWRPATATHQEPRSIEIPAASGEWLAVGKGPMDIRAYGTIDLGGGVQTGPDADELPGGARAISPRLPLGMLIGKIGESGAPFRIGKWNRISMSDTVYLVVNDDDHTDNTGFYTVEIRPSEPVRAPEDIR